MESSLTEADALKNLHEVRERLAVTICAIRESLGKLTNPPALVRSIVEAMNRILFQRVETPTPLGDPHPDHPDWKRHTLFLAVWDQWVSEALGFRVDDDQCRTLARSI